MLNFIIIRRRQLAALRREIAALRAVNLTLAEGNARLLGENLALRMASPEPARQAPKLCGLHYYSVVRCGARNGAGRENGGSRHGE